MAVRTRELKYVEYLTEDSGIAIPAPTSLHAGARTLRVTMSSGRWSVERA